MDLNNKLSELECLPSEAAWSAIESNTRQDTDRIHDLKVVPPEICWTKIAEYIKAPEEKSSNGQMGKKIAFPSWMRYAAGIAGITLLSISLMNNSIRNKFLNTLLESNLKTSLSDSQYILPANKKKSDTITPIIKIVPKKTTR